MAMTATRPSLLFLVSEPSADQPSSLPTNRHVWVDWVVIGGLSLLAFLALAVPSMLPVVDLPQHARILGIIVGHPDDVITRGFYSLNPVAPYWLPYLAGVPFTPFLAPTKAMQLATAVGVALSPLCIAWWLRSTGRRPITAVFAFLGLFGYALAWGLVGPVIGLPVLALTLAATETLARTGRFLASVAVAVLIVLLYYAHAFMWIAGVCGVVGLLVLRPVSWRRIVPVGIAISITISLMAAYQTSVEVTPFFRAYLDSHPEGFFDPDLGRLPRLFSIGAYYGQEGQRLALGHLLWALFAVSSLLHLRFRDAASPQPTQERWPRARHGLFRARYLMGFAVCALVFALSSQLYFLNQRALFLALVLLPALLPRARPNGFTMIAYGLSALTAVGICLGAFRAGADYSEPRMCVSELSEQVSAPGRTLWIVFPTRERGYSAQVDAHLGMYIVADQGGWPVFEFPDVGVGPVRATGSKPTFSLQAQLVHQRPESYWTGLGLQMDTIFTYPILDPRSVLRERADEYEYLRCDDYQVLFRRPADRNSHGD